MKILPFQALKCPLDDLVLTTQGSSWHCEKNHTYDTAKQGYINLLPVQNKRSLNPGDNKEMVSARHQFLKNGYYEPIAKIVAQKVLNELEPNCAISCLDAGCGEGYYLRYLSQSVHLDKTLHLIGVDISKWAVIEAAKRNKNIRWIVGSNSNLPIQDTSLDWVFSLFGFPIFTEFERVLKQGGKVLLIDAGENHLKELRQIIYPLLKPAKERRDTTPQNFTTIIEENISFPITLSTQEEIANLLAMTPHLYRANAEGRSKALALTQLTVTIDIDVKILLCDNS